MSQQQPLPVKYGDVLPVSGDLTAQPVRPRDASMMQSAENVILGETRKGGAAAAMQSAAARNEAAGLVGHGEVGPAAAGKGVAVTETELPGRRVVTESVGGQVVGQYMVPGHPVAAVAASPEQDTGKVTIGEALEASGRAVGDKPVEQSDAAAIQAAEIRATGRSQNVPGGVAAAAQSAASANVRATRDEEKIKMGDVLWEAASKLPSDKEATREDAAGVTAAELRNNPALEVQPGGVAAAVAAAARINESP